MCFLGYLLLTCVLIASQDGSPLNAPRVKRSNVQMCHVVSTYTHIGCLNYLYYGCHCDFTISSDRTQDPIESCCVMLKKCAGFGPYEHECSKVGRSDARYHVECNTETATCTCHDKPDSCLYRKCKCDTQFGSCVRGKHFNEAMVNYTMCHISN